MLCSLPSRAQPPIVDVVKWTLAAASKARASDTVIQSVADGIAQSPPDAAGLLDPEPPEGSALAFDPDPVPLDGFAFSPVVPPPPAFAAAPEPASVELESAEPESSLAGSDPDRAAAADRRSFLAQPEPLKWIEGAEIALRTGPEPHSGQLVGGASWTPWITSKRRPQAAHT
jgi:hypothetical protein